MFVFFAFTMIVVFISDNTSFPIKFTGLVMFNTLLYKFPVSVIFAPVGISSLNTPFSSKNPSYV